MQLREFITGRGSTAAWPLGARAQQSKPVVGFLDMASPALRTLPMAGFHRGLNETGYAEGRNVTIEYRWKGGRYDRLPALAADLVGRRVAVIFAIGPPGIGAVKTRARLFPSSSLLVKTLSKRVRPGSL
jgi:putative tryptophan/tyrosine transport system substrate-binding protein